MSEVIQLKSWREAMLLRFQLARAAAVASVVVSPKCVDLSLIKTAKEHVDGHGA